MSHARITTNAGAPTSTLFRPQGKSARDLIAVNAGNSLEWYDWTIYTIFATAFAGQFFPSEDKAASLLAALAVFAVGFITRPIGGWVFGRYADRKGRKASLTLAMTITALGSLAIALAPSYDIIGVGASVLLLVVRLVQGLAHGGEMGTAVTYLVERAPTGRRALWGSTSWVSVFVGTILATLTGLLINSLFTLDEVSEWAWRIPFAVGGLLGLYALWLRRRIHETANTQSVPVVSEQRGSVWSRLKPHMRGVLVVLGLSAGGSIMFYTWVIYTPTQAAISRGQDPSSALTASLLAQVILLIALPLLGMLSDRIGRKPLIITFAAGFMLLVFPLDGLVDGTFWGLFLAMTGALLLIACLFAVNGAVWAEVFPTAVRAAGVAAPLSIATAVFGGTAPYLNQYFTALGQRNLFLWYLVAVAAVTLVTALLTKETKDVPLDR